MKTAWRSTLTAIALLVFSVFAGDETTVICDYPLTAKNVTGQTQGPERLENSAGDAYGLTRHGRPRYMNVVRDPGGDR